MKKITLIKNIILYIIIVIAFGIALNNSPYSVLLLVIAISAIRAIYVIPSQININEKGIKLGNSNLKYSNIKEVNLLDTKPVAFKLIGLDFGKQVGDFWVKGYGICRIYTKNPGGVILIKTEKKKFFFNLESEEETILKYNQIINAKLLS
ncbi:MAG: PH domain-containing protein [Sarcina sp.]